VKYTKIYTYFALEIFLLIMGWIVFHQLKLISYYTDYVHPSEEANPSIERVIWLISIFLVVTFLVITLLIVQEYMRLNAKKLTSAVNQFGSKPSDTHSGESPKNPGKKSTEDSERERLRINRQKLLNCFEKEIFSQPEKNNKFTGEKILSCISTIYELTQAEIFIKTNAIENETKFKLLSTYAIHVTDSESVEFSLGEGLIGQVAQSGKHLYIDKLPEGFLNVKSGLGQSDPNCLLILPWKDEKGETFAVIELASFRLFDLHDIKLLESISESFFTRFSPWINIAKNA